jgi:hypothetical protein
VALTKTGALKIAAARIGVSFEDYLSKQAAGLKWCRVCRDWHERSAFPKDSTRTDGLAPLCTAQMRNKYRRSYQPVPPELRRPYGPPQKPCVSGDKKQARHLVNQAVTRGKLPRPDSIPCSDCGHVSVAGERHEYDHHLGYDAEHHMDVQAVCVPCHKAREKTRRLTWA